MAKKQNDDEPDPKDNDEREAPKPKDEPAPPTPKEAPKPPRRVTPLEGETTRVLLTGDNRGVVTEHYIPTAEFGFRIYVEGMGHFEHVGEAADSGTWIFAPTR